ncbi:unnamed protein product [Rotaria socialis]|uniref:Uncharacterized protein n=1 Tax=Rotaria socialis TaxID=392032 RepID=A0A818CQ70_9BILA|nr:unnamed protein product [Rotaria socialis]
MTDNEEQQQEREMTFVDDNKYQFTMDVPIPTNRNYHFNVQQKLDIENFFQQKNYLHSQNNHFDLYEAQIIAVYITFLFGFNSMENLPMLNNMDWFDDIFDIVNIDDDKDDDQQEVERMIIEDYYEDLNLNSDQEEDGEEEEEQESTVSDERSEMKTENVQEEMLSQKLSQLSTEGQKRPLSTPTASQEENSKKKICLPTDVNVQQPQQTNQITAYLETMDTMFKRTLFNDARIPPNNLQVLIDCKQQIELTQLHLKRWTRYYEIGSQQQIWSKEIVKLFTMKKIDENEYEIYVEKYVNELNRKLEQLQQQMNTLKEDCPHLLEEFIQTYRLLPWKMKSDCHLTQLEYDYQDQLLEREFLSLQPTKEQIEFRKNLNKLYYEYRRAKKEFNELKHRIQCNQPTQESVTQALFMLLTTTTAVTNPNFYHQEIDQDENKLQEYLNNFMVKSIQEAEKKILQCKLLFQEQEQQQLSQSVLT